MYSIVAVHGLGAHSVYTWTRKLSKEETERRLKDGFIPKEETERCLKDGFIPREAGRVNWLQEFIPKLFPTARVILFGHNADWFFMAPFRTSQESAKNLLKCLEKLRRDDKVGFLSFLRCDLPYLTFPRLGGPSYLLHIALAE
jgi:hypothetical protein